MERQVQPGTEIPARQKLDDLPDAPGVYLYRLTAGSFKDQKRMVLAK